MRNHLTPREIGLSLIELLTVLTIIVLLAQASSAGFKRMLESIRITIQVNHLNQTLQLARQLAWSQNTDLALCQSQTGLHCDSSAGWAQGWILFRNEDGDHPPEVDPGEHIERRAGRATGLRISANRDAFVMRPFGQRATNGTFHICPTRNALPGRDIIVSYTGKTRLASTKCPA
jgi:Tfp pilus assembly protein FimT